MQVEDTYMSPSSGDKIKDLPKHTTILHCHHKSYQRNRRHLKKVNEKQDRVMQTNYTKTPSSDITTNNSPPNNS